MDINGSQDQLLQSQFSLEQAKAFSMEQKLKNHENKQDLMNTARKFEGIFINQMLQAMDKTVDRSSGILNGGSGEDMFRGMLYDKISESISTRPGGSGFGLANEIYKQLEAKLPKTQDPDPSTETSKGGMP